MVAHDLAQNRFYVIDLFRSQANKLLNVCESDLEKVMRMLDFKNGQMIVKHQDLVMSYEQFMPQKAS